MKVVENVLIKGFSIREWSHNWDITDVNITDHNIYILSWTIWHKIIYLVCLNNSEICNIMSPQIPVWTSAPVFGTTASVFEMHKVQNKVQIKKLSRKTFNRFVSMFFTLFNLLFENLYFSFTTWGRSERIQFFFHFLTTGT